MPKPPFNTIFLGAIAVLILLNAALLIALQGTRQRAIEAATEAAGLLEQMRQQPLDAPFSASAAIDQVVTLPIKTSVTINATVNVPVTLPIVGESVSVAVPIHTTVPIETSISIPVKATIPVKVSFNDSTFDDMLQKAHDWLVRLAESL